MTPRELEEYKALRATIRTRGTTRVWIALAGFLGWAATALTTAGLVAPPVATFVPLLVLAVTFEIVFSLHTSVERIGRYIQVFFEADEPGWEQRIMAFASKRGMPGAGDPLLAAYFWTATLFNMMPALIVGPLPVEWAAVGIGHLLFIARVALARRQALGQRARDLQRFQKIKEGSA
jgi:hypothetical protein